MKVMIHEYRIVLSNRKVMHHLRSLHTCMHHIANAVEGLTNSSEVVAHCSFVPDSSERQAMLLDSGIPVMHGVLIPSMQCDERRMKGSTHARPQNGTCFCVQRGSR